MANHFWPKKRLRRGSGNERRRAAWNEGLAAATRCAVLSHGHCLDGVASVIVARRRLEGVGTLYAQPSHVLAALELVADTPADGRTLLIADLSMQKPDFDAVVAACARAREAGWQIEWRDHHHKQWEGLDLDRLEKHLDVLEVDRKAKESGATLMQKAIAPRDKFLKALAQTVRDRDLWWNKTPDSETLEFALTELGEDAFTAHYLAHDGKGPVVDDVIQAAADRERARQATQTAAVLRTVRFHGEPPQRAAIVYGWLPKNTGLHELLEHEDCAVAINIRPNGKMSLRSRKAAPVCHRIAGRFGGGGHPNASGGDLGLRGAAFWWYVLRRGRVPIHDRLAAAALEELAAGPDP